MLALSVTATFWLEAYGPEAYVCTFVMVTGGFVWYHFCLRIYNRFKFDDNFTDKWNKSEMEKMVKDDLDIPVGLTKEQMDSDDGSRRVLRVGGSSSSAATPADNKTKRFLLSRLLRRSQTAEEITASASADVAVDPSTLRKAGYMVVAPEGESASVQRYYMVLVGTNLWFYNDRRAYETDPDRPARTRPLQLPLYVVEIKSGLTVPQISLTVNTATAVSQLKGFEFQCDTIEETKSWYEVLVRAATEGTQTAAIL